MNFKRALWVSVLTYVLSFIIGLAVMMVVGANMEPSTEIPDSFLYIGIVVTIIVAIFFTSFYFKDKSIKANAKEGLFFGLVLIIFGTIIDSIMFLLGSFAGLNSMNDLIDYYSDPLFWLALISFIVTTTLVGFFKSKKNNSNKITSKRRSSRRR